MILTKTSIRRPVMMTMIILTFTIFGIVSFIRLPIDLMPNIELPYVTVQTIYPGAGPEEIETAVIKPIEEQMTTVSNIKNITSYCSEGIGFVLLEFNLGINPDLAAIDVKDKIDAILYNLPRDLQKPIIGKFDINAQPILNYAVTGPQSAEMLRRIADKQIKERLVRIGGVSSITISGGREREIQVNLHKDKLDGLNLSLTTVAGIIAAQTANIPGGHISGDRREYTIRVQGQFDNIDQIANLGIPVAGRSSGGGGGQGGNSQFVPLSSIADVVDTYKEIREKARFNRENSVGLAIQKRPDANTVAVAQEVMSTVAKINQELPPGTKISIAQDRSQFIKDSVSDMYFNIVLGVILISVMLLFFLHDWRLTIIAAVIIPASLVIAFVGMQALGFSLNVITLMAIAITVGTLVTNSIVVLENIARHRDTGMSVMESAEAGANEVFVPVLATVLTHCAVFLPMVTIHGIVAQFFKALGFTIIITTVVSFLLSFTLAPMMSSRMLQPRNRMGTERRRNILESFLAYIGGGYLGMLRWALAHPVIVILATLLTFVGTIAYVGPRVGLEFFTQGDQGIISISVEMPPGASLEATDRVLATIEERVSTIPELKSVYSALGGSGTNSGVNIGSLIVRLKDKKERTRSGKDVERQMRPLLADIPDAKIVVKEMQSMGGGRSQADITVEVTGDNMEEILRLADSVKSLTQQVSGLVDAQLSWKAAKPEIKFLPDRLRLDEYGMTVAQLGMNLRNALTGNEATVYREENDDYKVRVQYAPRDRASIDQIENVSVQTAKGLVPMTVLNKMVYEGGAANIERKNRQRLVVVSANVMAGAVGTKAGQLQALTDKIKVPPGYKIYYGGQQEQMRETFSSLGFALMLAIILTFMVLAATIESLAQPLLILVTIPLGLIGILWALFVTGKSISMISLMSFIMLVGVVVNNAILIIDFAHQRQREGLSKRDAILEACRAKFNAILMMNIAIVLASLPQALNINSIQSPFAVTAIGGIIVSTIMTLFVIPSMYAMGAKAKMAAGERQKPDGR